MKDLHIINSRKIQVVKLTKTMNSNSFNLDFGAMHCQFTYRNNKLPNKSKVVYRSVKFLISKSINNHESDLKIIEFFVWNRLCNHNNKP